MDVELNVDAMGRENIFIIIMMIAPACLCDDDVFNSLEYALYPGNIKKKKTISTRSERVP